MPPRLVQGFAVALIAIAVAGCDEPGFSEAPWPVGTNSNPWAFTTPGGGSNVSGALGHVGGVLTMTIPIEECFREDGQACVLRYARDAATLTGKVVDTRGNNEPIARTTLRLVDLDRDPGSPATHRVASRPGTADTGSAPSSRGSATISSCGGSCTKTNGRIRPYTCRRSPRTPTPSSSSPASTASSMSAWSAPSRADGDEERDRRASPEAAGAAPGSPRA